MKLFLKKQKSFMLLLVVVLLCPHIGDELPSEKVTPKKEQMCPAGSLNSFYRPQNLSQGGFWGVESDFGV